jgi:ATP-dependent DNA helicase RecG
LGKSRRKIYEITLVDDSGKITCKFFRIPYKGYFERFQAQQEVQVIGKVLRYRGKVEFHHPEIREYNSSEETYAEGLLPIYAETDGLSSKKIGNIIQHALAQMGESRELAASKSLRRRQDQNPQIGRIQLKRERDLRFIPRWHQGEIPDFLPVSLRERYELLDRETALRNIHSPPQEAGQEYLRFRSPSQKRIIFEEFFWLELMLGLRKVGLKSHQAPAMEKDLTLVNRLRKSLPFHLTEGQERSFAEILEDLSQSCPMGRLIQGDVGSGKTLVALMSALVAKSNGYQTGLMVPTEILAEQHFRNAKEFLEPLGVRLGLLLGSQKTKEKEENREKLRAGEIDLCVGTHALIQEGVEFSKLGLVIVDEQHRFGVDQRKKLMRKGVSPHFLVMTATPIPRTLAMTVYGDLDFSIIDHLPQGRQPIVTRVTYESKRQQVLQFIAQHLKEGRQAYIVYPLVEESEKIDLKDAVSEYEMLKEYFNPFSVGLLHGKMRSEEKEQVMSAFRKNEIHVLVSTTVIEVGVDVPNASIMLIVHAERFGLSQLHQLRGRVGRGQHKSYCVLMLGYAVSDVGRERAMIMERHADGFKISEADLELRGPGEFLGTRQSGLPVNILQAARTAAFQLLKSDPQLLAAENEVIRKGWLCQQEALGENLIG